MAVTPLRSPDAAARWLREWVRGSLQTDSRRVQPGDGFIAWPGYATDGRRYVQAAFDAGATTCLVEQAGLEAFGLNDARVASLPHMKAATGAIADAYYGEPSAAMQMVAVTGTNGKTSSSWWVAQALTLLGRRCGVVGTLGVGVPPSRGEASALAFTGLTTPDPVLLHRTLREFVDRGFAACALEASSIGLDEHRLTGTRLTVALFTNFTQDHLDYHGSMQAYWVAKRKLFDWPGLKAAVINVDDDAGMRLAQALVASDNVKVITCGTRPEVPSDLTATEVRYLDGGLAFVVRETGSDARIPVRSTLIGDYNVSNVLGVIGVLRALDVSLIDASASVAHFTPVPGRMQRVGDGSGPQVVVDYAHTPDALDKTLAALRPLARERGGRLVCVFGCGGDRDPGKRPRMGAIAAARADVVVLTSDNPRSEAPLKILADIAGGLPPGHSARSIEDRRSAIEQTVQAASHQDVILVAGKGHEDYQEIRGVKHPFSDVDEVQGALAQRMHAERRA